MRGMAIPVWRLALADLAHEWRASLVTVLAVTVALAPLLILFGLWSGVVETMRARLAADPANLELRHRPVPALEPGWIARAAAQPGVAFVVPRTRYVNLQVTMLNRADPAAEPADVILAPTAPGDPVLAHGGVAVPEGDAIVLGARAAEALGVARGDTVTLALRRIGEGGRREAVALPLAVAGVLPAAVEGAVRGYAPLAVLEDIQSYQEWVRVAPRGWPGGEPRGDAWGGFRLYARSIDDVEPVRRWLVGQGFDVTSAADRIAFVRRVDRDLGALFLAILGLTATGYAASLGLTQLAAVARKRRTYGVLRLIGYRARAIALLPVLQGAGLAFLGALAAVLVYHAMQPVIGALFRELVAAEGSLMRLPWLHAGAALGASVGLAALASLAAARRVMAISPAETLRDA